MQYYNFHQITNKIIQDYGLKINKNSPLYHALLFRVRLSLKFEKFEDRLEIVQLTLMSL